MLYVKEKVTGISRRNTSEWDDLFRACLKLFPIFTREIPFQNVVYVDGVRQLRIAQSASIRIYFPWYHLGRKYSCSK